MSLSFELAKKLKDAGFPQLEHLIEEELDKIPLHRVGYHLTADDLDVDENGILINKARLTSIYGKSWILSEDGLAHTVYIPTLIELIEACGSKFYELRLDRIWIARGRNKKVNWQYYDEPWETITLEGATPDEAVARLWLTLCAKEGNS